MSQLNDDYTAVLLEDLRGDIKMILEVLQPFPKMQNDVATLKEDVAELKSDMKIVKHAIRETNLELRNHTHGNSLLRSKTI
jgi:hypothetical protein